MEVYECLTRAVELNPNNIESHNMLDKLNNI